MAKAFEPSTLIDKWLPLDVVYKRVQVVLGGWASGRGYLGAPRNEPARD